MRLNLPTNLPMCVYTFQAMWRHRPLEEYLVFVGIRDAHTSFSPFTLTTLASVVCRRTFFFSFFAREFISKRIYKFDHIALCIYSSDLMPLSFTEIHWRMKAQKCTPIHDWSQCCNARDIASCVIPTGKSNSFQLL